MSNDIQGSFIKVSGASVLNRIMDLRGKINFHNGQAIAFYWKEKLAEFNKEEETKKEIHWFWKLFGCRTKRLHFNTTQELIDYYSSTIVYHPGEGGGDYNPNAWWYMYKEDMYCIKHEDIARIERLEYLVKQMSDPQTDMFLSESDNSFIVYITRQFNTLQKIVNNEK